MSIKNNRGIINYNLDLRNFARTNRKNSTPAEIKIWLEILSYKKLGYKFTRQKPIDNFILDFYCSKLLLAIEVDGDSHYRKEQIIFDQARTEKMRLMGIKVLRYTNNDVFNNIDGIHSDLSEQIKIRVEELKR